jgi:hypothetical protein
VASTRFLKCLLHSLRAHFGYSVQNICFDIGKQIIQKGWHSGGGHARCPRLEMFNL